MLNIVCPAFLDLFEDFLQISFLDITCVNRQYILFSVDFAKCFRNFRTDQSNFVLNCGKEPFDSLQIGSGETVFSLIRDTLLKG
jgi:hypothetical protein